MSYQDATGNNINFNPIFYDEYTHAEIPPGARKRKSTVASIFHNKTPSHRTTRNQRTVPTCSRIYHQKANSPVRWDGDDNNEEGEGNEGDDHDKTPTTTANKKRKRKNLERYDLNRVGGIITHNNVYEALGIDISSPKSDVIEKIRGVVEVLKGDIGTFFLSEEDKALCISRFNVISSIMKRAQTRIIYIESVNCKNLSGAPIRLPKNEVLATAYLTMVVLGAISYPPLWVTREAGFPVRTSDGGYAWVNGQTLVATKKPCIEVVSSVLKIISRNIAIKKSELTEVAESLRDHPAWPARAESMESRFCYFNGMLNTSAMTFTKFSHIKEMNASTPTPSLSPSFSWPFSVNTIQQYEVSDEDISLLESARSYAIDSATGIKTGVDLENWMNGWDRNQCMESLAKKMPMYSKCIDSHTMTRSSWNKSTLYRGLSRSISCIDDRPGERALVIMGPSGCGKSTSVDVPCKMVGPDRYFVIVENTAEQFSQEPTVGKKLIVHSDVCETNLISFEQLSNSSDRNSRLVNIKLEKNVVCPPPSLLIATSNSPKVIRVPKGRAMDAAAIGSRVLPFIFDGQIEDTAKDSNARENIWKREGFYLAVMMMTHSTFSEMALVSSRKYDGWKVTESGLLSVEMKRLINWFSSENIKRPHTGRGAGESNVSLNNIPKANPDKNEALSINRTFWNEIVGHVIVKNVNDDGIINNDNTEHIT